MRLDPVRCSLFSHEQILQMMYVVSTGPKVEQETLPCCSFSEMIFTDHLTCVSLAGADERHIGSKCGVSHANTDFLSSKYSFPSSGKMRTFSSFSNRYPTLFP